MSLRQAINSLKALHEAMPEELKDKVMHRYALCRLLFTVMKIWSIEIRTPHLQTMAQRESNYSNPCMETRQAQFKTCLTLPTRTWVFIFLHSPGVRRTQVSFFQGGFRKRLVME